MSLFASLQPLGVLSRQSCGLRQLSNATFTGMAATLRQDEEFRRAALTLIRSGDETADLLIQALGSACSREAQQALNRLVRDAPPGAPLRATFLRSLSDAFEPLAETVETHFALLDDPDLGEQALLGLGKLIHALVRHHEWEQARRSLHEILARLRYAEEDDQRIRCLRALAYAGHPEAFDFVRPYLYHPSAGIRREAVGAVQRIPGDVVDLCLVGKALADGCQDVREQAVVTLGRRPPSEAVTGGLRRVAATDPEPEVRRQAAAVLAALDPAGGAEDPGGQSGRGFG